MAPPWQCGGECPRRASSLCVDGGGRNASHSQQVSTKDERWEPRTPNSPLGGAGHEEDCLPTGSSWTWGPRKKAQPVGFLFREGSRVWPYPELQSGAVQLSQMLKYRPHSGTATNVPILQERKLRLQETGASRKVMQPRNEKPPRVFCFRVLVRHSLRGQTFERRPGMGCS